MRSASNVAPPPGITPDRWLGTRELAEYYGCSPRTIEGWRARGCGPPASRDPGGRWRTKLSEADAFLREQRGAA